MKQKLYGLNEYLFDMLLMIRHVCSLDYSCLFGDFIKLYLHLDGSRVNTNNIEFTDILCGKSVDIEQTHYSSGPTLAFEFHSDWRGGNNTGFRGTYRFLKQCE